MTVLPYKEEPADKKAQVARMFNNIATTYDLLNHVLSLGIDVTWRKKATKMLARWQPKHLLDVATGTADFAIELSKIPSVEQVVGVDISEKMLEHGREKVRQKKLSEKILLEYGDSENLQYENNTFDAVTVAFGVRNFANLEKGLQEIFRVLKPGGVLLVLEFSKPKRFPIKQLYRFYFTRWVPFIGKLISKDRAAYAYLPESVDAFPDGMQFVDILKQTGFKETKWYPLTFGISSIYLGVKPS
ncbi:demethylmenaquinone methyltransferase/2-methoxy-6-polyprenyl-1,4-benzoquinol methylase [Thermonema lapsum]|uniref:Demethylmenaquinone methyltransferase n=1 Tax=Thermonema lapsum TaxID=28195 RepID=A0A846MT26_9BACT|nr:bifunctional demethylmenaquinone methyltransferase/2-methoxy-6-polyprenyl-1,4-benzoquinol methylase UbiE [Thermonema lapsum]NIK74460.1 demethylmenaquinone methyltransferase/2-methoxy-6-polyprenyl-1,4-benzoquinol methylase [Thermonema lapsum]